MYKVVIEKKVKNDLDILNKNDLKRILNCLVSLKTESRPKGVKKLKGSDDFWRIRIGNYRIVYEINDDEEIVIILRIKHRKEAYK